MKSFYKFYEQISIPTGQKIYVTCDIFTYNPEYAYVDYNDAFYALSPMTYIQDTVLYDKVNLSHKSLSRPIVVIKYKDYIVPKRQNRLVGAWLSETGARLNPPPGPKFDWADTITFNTFLWMPFYSNTKASTPKPPSTPKSPYANLKYPLVGELTHYLSTQNLNQEIYQVMRDRSQKSINLVNYLKTLIKKIELV